MNKRVARLRLYRTMLRWFAAAILVIGFVPLVPWGKLADSLKPPPDADQIYGVGTRAMAANDLGVVQAAAEALSDIKDVPPYAQVLEGFVHLRTGRVRDAVAAFEVAREHPRTSAIANMLAGEALYRNRQYTDAMDAFSTAVSLDPALTDAHRRLASILYDIGATEPTVRELRIVSRQAPSDPRPHRLLGLMFKDMESFGVAVVEYREALRRDPNLPERATVLVELSTCLLKLGRHKEVLETIRQCPRTAEALAIEAESRFSEGDAQGAEKLIDAALTLTPNHLESLLLRGTIQLSSRAMAEAAKTLRQAVDHHPKDFIARYKLSQAYAASGQADLAREQAAESTRLRDLRERFADLHAKAATDTDDADLRYQLGLMATELGRTDLAISWYTAAVALDPNHVRAREALQVSVMNSEANGKIQHN